MVKLKESDFIPRTPSVVSVIFFMDVSDLKEFLGRIPKKKKVKTLEKMILALSQYHLECHESQVLLADKLDRIIRSIDQ